MEVCQTASNKNNTCRNFLWATSVNCHFAIADVKTEKENYTVLWFSWSSGGSRTFTNSTFTWISTPNIRATLKRMSCSWRIPVRKGRDERGTVNSNVWAPPVCRILNNHGSMMAGHSSIPTTITIEHWVCAKHSESSHLTQTVALWDHCYSHFMVRIEA
jgi:hypothetical protein